MSDEYRQGDWWIMDDQTGQKVRASETRQQWDGLVVDKRYFDRRQPLDFLRQIKDDPSVPYARPREVDQFVGPLQTTLTQNAAAQANLLYVDSNVRMLVGDRITLALSTGDVFTTFISSISTLGQIQINPPLPSNALAGAVVTDYTATTGANVP